MAFSYPTVTDLKSYLNITSTAQDSLLFKVLANAICAVEDRTSRKFNVNVDTTRYFDVETDVDRTYRHLYLDEDLLRVTSIVNGDGTAVTSDQYILLPKNEEQKYEIYLLADSGVYWTWSDEPIDSISVTGLWGYSESCPPPVFQAILRLSALFFHQKDNAMDTDRPIMAAGALLLPAEMPRDIEQLLWPYVRLV